ncbi:FkbM family methyltransferase [Halovivax gelatinilyticus]|uniref:FkbM family methyltransferase n=1 Tax=Halovivax gelatinilyticus TaxID=2961597 RepID=UPI0020CA77FC|nr:FkbM family methyltransferase [Halovivax gelatinilyticus]
MSQFHHRLRSLYRIVRSRGVSEALQISLVNPLVGAWAVADGTATVDGLTYAVEGAPVSVFTRGSIARGRHEREERALLERHLPTDADVVELGAGIGYLTALAADRTNGSVVAVETNPDLIPILERTRAMNVLEYAIEHAAYAPDADEVDFPVATNYKFSSVHKRSARTVSVPATSLEALARRHGIEECVLVVDVEGTEIDMVRDELPHPR